MSVDQAPPLASRSLLLIDEDEAFRLKLRDSLAQSGDFEWMEDADGQRTLQILEAARGFGAAEQEMPGEIALVILDMNLGRSLQWLSLCQRIKGQYPDLPILLLSAVPDANQLNAARQAGVEGYCSKSLPVASLLAIIRRVAGGQAYWMPLNYSVTGQTNRPTATAKTVRSPRPPSLRLRLRQSGLTQIDEAMAELANALQGFDLSLLERAIAAGRYRELRAARWLIDHLWVAESDENGQFERSEMSDRRPVSRGHRDQKYVQPQALPAANPFAITTQPSAVIEPIRDLRSLLFDSISAKLQTSLENQTETPLETDILREDKKRELFYLVLRKIEDLLAELTYSQVQAVQLKQKQAAILQDLWEAILTDFFGKYYTVSLAGMEVEVVDVLLQDVEIIQAAILDKIPSVSELLRHLLFQAPLEIDNALYPPGNPEALVRAEAILSTWMIHMANAVMQPLLNRFANVEVIKQTFFDRRLLSIRDIERFRNNLSWKYRLETLIQEPTDIFESKQQLWFFSGRGIHRMAVYAIRYQELESLEGIPRAITLVLEARDAIAPRLRSVVSLVGNSVVYVLTEVIGRGLGLIGRGVLKGMGNAWQDKRMSRK
jgi:DNA-binding NarL/FixJ family response regulator